LTTVPRFRGGSVRVHLESGIRVTKARLTTLASEAAVSLKRFAEPLALVGIVVAAATLLWLITPARAACYEDIGCTNDHYFSKAEVKRMSCQNLWYVRNGIYNENGYCFKTAAGKEAFDNSDCSHASLGAVPLNAYERGNIATLKWAEGVKGCQ
jgi:hypothetical protein